MTKWNDPRILEVNFEDVLFEFKLKPLTYGEKTKLINNSTVSKFKNGMDELTIDNMKFQMGLLRIVVKEIKINGEKQIKIIETIENLPPSVGDKLYEEAQKISGFLEEKSDEE